MTSKKRIGESDIARPLSGTSSSRKAESGRLRKEPKPNTKKKLKRGVKSPEQAKIAAQAQISIQTQPDEPKCKSDKALIEDYIAILSHDFGVEFGQPGEKTISQFELDAQEQYAQGRPLSVRFPRLDELRALHRAIELSPNANNEPKDEKTTRVMFVDGDLVKGEENGARIKFSEDGCPMLFITPSLCEKGAPTEAERRPEDTHESWQVIIMREFAWKSAADAKIFPLAPEDYDSLGWSPIMAEEFTGLYAMKTKAGAMYAPYEDGIGTDQAWARCDQNGVLLNCEGEPAIELRDVAYLSNKEMAKRAEVRPCGELFTSAEEEIVDALRCYRQSPEWRIHLELYCPELYKAVLSIEKKLGNER